MSSLASRLSRAHEALRTAEQTEAAERATLAAILERERQTQYALEQTAGSIRTAKDWQVIQEARTRAVELEHAHHTLARARHDQAQVVQVCHDRTKDARIAVEALAQQVGRLQRALRHEEQVVATRQRAVIEGEAAVARAQEELARIRQGLAEAQAALDQVHHELATVGAPDLDRVPRTKSPSP